MPPPKFKAPLSRDKMIVAPDPPQLANMLETYTAVQPITTELKPEITEVKEVPKEATKESTEVKEVPKESTEVKEVPKESTEVKEVPTESTEVKEVPKEATEVNKIPNVKKAAKNTKEPTVTPVPPSIVPTVSTKAPSTDLVELESKIKKEIEKDTVGVKLTTTVPTTRRAFANFMLQTFRA